MNYKNIFNGVLFCVLCFISVFSLNGQFLKVPVNVALPVETESFSRLVSDESSLYFLQKDKSKEITTKKFQLVKYSDELVQDWSREVLLNQFENILDFSHYQNTLRLVTVEHNLDSMVSSVIVRKFLCETGVLESKSMVSSYEIGEWLSSYGKANVAQTFESAVAARQAVNDVTPLEYKFTLDYSLDSSKVVVYQYDNSQDKLVVNGAVFDADFNLLNKLNVSVDDAHDCYGLKVDNNGEIYLLKVSNSGKLAVLNLNLDLDQEKYLTLPKGSTDKVNPRLYIHENHEVYLVYCNVKNDHLQSVSLATLNFDTEEVDDQHVHKLEAEFLNSLNTNIRNGDKYFELAEIEEIDNHLVVILEQHQIEGSDIHYHPNDQESLSHWETGSATITTGNVLVLVFNKELDPQGKFTIFKNQKGAITDGMNTLSHHIFREKNGVKFVYSNRTKGITNNEFHLSYLDVEKMKLNDAVISTHGSDMVPVLTSTIFTPDGSVVFLTRKGILGRKNYLNKWHYNSH